MGEFADMGHPDGGERRKEERGVINRPCRGCQEASRQSFQLSFLFAHTIVAFIPPLLSHNQLCRLQLQTCQRGSVCSWWQPCLLPCNTQ